MYKILSLKYSIQLNSRKVILLKFYSIFSSNRPIVCRLPNLILFQCFQGNWRKYSWKIKKNSDHLGEFYFSLPYIGKVQPNRPSSWGSHRLLQLTGALTAAASNSLALIHSIFKMAWLKGENNFAEMLAPEKKKPLFSRDIWVRNLSKLSCH